MLLCALMMHSFLLQNNIPFMAIPQSVQAIHCQQLLGCFYLLAVTNKSASLCKYVILLLLTKFLGPEQMHYVEGVWDFV